MKIVNIICSAFVGALMLSGCMASAPLRDSEEVFSEMYKGCSMNEVLSLKLTAPAYSGEESLDFLLESISDVSVIFPNDNNLRLLSFDDGQNQWIEEKNNISYFPLDAKYIIGKNNPKIELDHQFVGIIPSIDREKPLRVVVHGYIYKDGAATEQCAGAYDDILFTP